MALDYCLKQDTIKRCREMIFCIVFLCLDKKNMQPLEFIKFTPRTNCGECGYAACLAFAAAVTKGGENPEKCPDRSCSIGRLTSGQSDYY